MHPEEVLFRNKLIRTLNMLTWYALIVGVCLLAIVVILWP